MVDDARALQNENLFILDSVQWRRDHFSGRGCRAGLRGHRLPPRLLRALQQQREVLAPEAGKAAALALCVCGREEKHGAPKG